MSSTDIRLQKRRNLSPCTQTDLLKTPKLPKRIQVFTRLVEPCLTLINNDGVIHSYKTVIVILRGLKLLYEKPGLRKLILCSREIFEFVVNIYKLKMLKLDYYRFAQLFTILRKNFLTLNNVNEEPIFVIFKRLCRKCTRRC